MSGRIRSSEDVARLAVVPPDPPAAPSSPDVWVVCFQLNRLARRLRLQGWIVRFRYTGVPPLLHVVDGRVPWLGDSITAVRDETGWSYASSTGERLASCGKPGLAVLMVDRRLGAVVRSVLMRRSR